jgi:protein tyrosine phosphatase (PTP) superfamily phosphohydrolase (DUF442 family)
MLDQIVNFVPVGDRLATGGQLTEAQLEAVRAAGYEVVVDLSVGDPRWSLEDEAGKAAALGLQYENIPVDFKLPREADFVRFVQVMEAVRERKVFVHCVMNYRVSCFLALYGESHLGWTREAADRHIALVWEPDPTWRGFLAWMRDALGRVASG